MYYNNSLGLNKHALDKLNDSKCKWDWCLLGKNPIITWDIVIAYPDKPWSWWALSKKPSITCQHSARADCQDGQSLLEAPWNNNIEIVRALLRSH
jgi:hypothetical protein